MNINKEDKKKVIQIINEETRNCKSFKDWFHYSNNYDWSNKKGLFPMLAQNRIKEMIEACLIRILLKNNLMFEEVIKFSGNNYYRITINREYGNYLTETVINDFINDLDMDFEYELKEHINTHNEYLEYIFKSEKKEEE